METVTVSRHLDADPGDVRALVSDAGPFMEAGGFDDVAVDGDTITLLNRVGIATMELVLERTDDDAALSFEQRDGIFDEMWTTYAVEEDEDGARVEATTEFSLRGSVVGDFLSATVVRKQRIREIEAQFDWLEAELE